MEMNDSSLRDAMLQEFRGEAAVTKRVLDRVPVANLDWQPHRKSMTLGQLAMHIATLPGTITTIAAADAFDAAQGNFTPPKPKTLDEIQTALEHSIREVERMLTETSDAAAMASWHLMAGDRELLNMPRANVWRTLMLNHWYHHRGQLAVYLRLLDVPVPAIYGPSADESPFPA